MERIPKKLEDIVKSKEPVRLERVHFKKFGDFSLDFEVAYYIDIQQEIKFDLMKAFKEMQVEFEVPTQTIHTVKED